MTREQAAAILAAHGITDKVVWIGYRSANSKYGEYDDVAGLFTPDSYTEFKFNTLPTKWEGDIAKLTPGVYRYKKGLHGIHHINTALPGDKAVYDWLIVNPGKDHAPVLVNGAPRLLPYWAFRQAGPVTVLRHGAAATETQADPARWPFIDLHKGGHYTTSSEGCQTFIADEWAQARALGYGAMDKYGQEHILYCLVQL
jgi:hypothetical protein